MTHHITHISETVVGFVGAGASSLAMYLSQAMTVSEPVQNWVQLGGTVGLIGCLSYACVTLWKTLQITRAETSLAVREAAAAAAKAVSEAENRITIERAAFIKSKDELEKEIRTDWKNQNDKLISVLEKLDNKE